MVRTAVPYLFWPAKQPATTSTRPTPSRHVLAALEVGQQGVVEDPARRAEHGALEMVDEQLPPDREDQAQQHGVGREQHTDHHAHPRTAPGQQRRRPGRGLPTSGSSQMATGLPKA